MSPPPPSLYQEKQKSCFPSESPDMIRKWYCHFEEMQDTFFHFENLFIFQNVIVGESATGALSLFNRTSNQSIHGRLLSHYRSFGGLQFKLSVRFFSVSRERGMQYVEFIKEKLTFFLMYQKTMANS